MSTAFSYSDFLSLHVRVNTLISYTEMCLDLGCRFYSIVQLKVICFLCTLSVFSDELQRKRMGLTMGPIGFHSPLRKQLISASAADVCLGEETRYPQRAAPFNPKPTAKKSRSLLSRVNLLRLFFLIFDDLAASFTLGLYPGLQSF
ncbi:hypothetical protein DdX_09460 [Ditylenchus destructor]|uniref:Uncharacterized protein n=1 Tax=Ditylenchus destructor TaxID=166010 RepID=A0AAD4R6D0_9BILA|nr:hypothetical protein DdX_09460 [Ditylenchus destructor]